MAEGISLIAEQLKSDEGCKAAQLDVAKNYVEMYGEMGKSSNTMIFAKEAGDLNSLLAQAASVISQVAPPSELLPKNKE